MKCFFLTFISFIFVTNVLAQTEGTFTYLEESIYAPTSREAYDWFGSPCLYGDILFVGAMFSMQYCTTGSGAGHVYYYEKNSENDWDLIQRIESPEPEDCDHFGSDIAIDGDWMFIGAWWDSNNGYTKVGKVYRFQKVSGSWVHAPPDLYCPNPGNDDMFGVSLEINDGHAFIGALKDNGGNGSESGTVYHYTITSPGTLSYQEIITAPLAIGHDAGDNFGSDIGYYDSTLVISAYRDDNGGSAYIFELQGTSWNCIQKITGSDTESDDGWGEGIDIDKGVILSGSFLDDADGMLCVGSVYAYTKNEEGIWTERAIFRPSGARAYDYFGSRISLQNGVAAIGAFKRDDGVTDGGAVYFYEAYNSYTVKYRAGLNGSITGDTMQIIVHGDSSSMVTAISDEGYEFLNWSDDKTENPRKDFNITQGMILTANFQPLEIVPETTLYAGGAGCFNASNLISTDSPATIYSGESATLIAGNSIILLPDFHAQNGCYFHARITTTNDFCESVPAPELAIYTDGNIKENNPHFLVQTNNDELSSENIYKIFPNPAESNIYIEWTESDMPVQIMVSNPLGSVIMHKTIKPINQFEIDLSGFRDGSYFISVINGNKNYTRKILLIK